jgi:hypothetical protein
MNESGPSSLVAGWLLERWNGLDLDYGHLVREVGPLPDGSHTAFFHDRDSEPWTLLRGAVWWDDRVLPKYLEKAGVVYSPDDFTRNVILDAVEDDGVSGFGREWPSYWPPATVKVLTHPLPSHRYAMS